jgi:hypothetical protein
LRIYEITNPEDQLALLKMIMDNTWAAISRQPKTKAPVTKAAPVVPLRKPVKAKAIPKPKKAPYAAAPKPLPKPKPLVPSPIQVKSQQQKSQQDYAKTVQKTLAKTPSKPMPKSLQPLPGNIISPIGGGDPELEKKLDFSRRQGEQNRASGSEPHLLNKNPTY